MNLKNLIILAIITLAVIVTAAVLNQPTTTTTSSDNKKFFPHLLKSLDRVTEIIVSTKGEVATLTRNAEGVWQLQEKHNYPVALDKVHKLLIGVAELVKLEAKTNNPKLFNKLGLEDITVEASQSKQITLKTAKGKTLASLIVGNDKVAKTDSTLREIYVRRAEDKQAWLTIGQLKVEPAATNWLNTKIVDVDSTRVRNVSITHPDGDKVGVFKATPYDEDFQLADIPAQAKVKLPYQLKNIATTLSNLDLDDVTTANEITFADDASTRAVFTTFDGLEVTMVTMNKEDKHYAKFSAVFNPEAIWVEPATEDKSSVEQSPEATTAKDESSTELTPAVDSTEETKTSWQPKPADEIKQQIEKLNARGKDWVYILSDYKVDDLAKKPKDLIEEAKPVDTSDTPQIDELGTPATADTSQVDKLEMPATSVTATDKPEVPATADSE
jgi:hypothetical protein